MRCQGPECDREARVFLGAAGLHLCYGHRGQYVRKGELSPLRGYRPRGEACSIRYCGEAVKARGLCGRHYERSARAVTVEPECLCGARVTPPRRFCDECREVRRKNS